VRRIGEEAAAPHKHRLMRGEVASRICGPLPRAGGPARSPAQAAEGLRGGERPQLRRPTSELAEGLLSGQIRDSPE
jgi:hypothetical protein